MTDVEDRKPTPPGREDPLPPDPRKVQLIRAERLIVDPNYQRAIDPARYERILNMAQAWDWLRAEVATVVPIGGGDFRVTEGQGRVLALQLRDPSAKMPCVVLPADCVGHASEAHIALGIASSRTPHSALQRWRLRYAEGDPYVSLGEGILSRHGLRVGEHGGPQTLAAVAAVFGILSGRKRDPESGADLLDVTLRVLVNAWPVRDTDNATTRFDSLVLRVVSTVVERNPDIDAGRLTHVLADKSVRRWLNDADGQRSRYNLLGELIVSAYNRRKRGARARWAPVDPADEIAAMATEDEDESGEEGTE